MDDSVYSSIFKGQGSYGMVGAVVVAIAVPLFLSVILVGKKKAKERGVPVQVGGEAGFAMRNSRFAKLVEVPWEGELVSLFRKYSSTKKAMELPHGIPFQKMTQETTRCKLGCYLSA